MNDEYYNMLQSLYEAVSADNVDAFQSNIADTGKDLNDDSADPAPAQQMQAPAPEEAEDVPEDIGDADYLNNGDALNPADVPQSASPDISKKLIKLHALFVNLINYTESLRDTINDLDLGLLDDSKFNDVNSYETKLGELETKIRDYVIDDLKNDPYERALYVYIVLRTELLTLVKALRQAFGVNTAA